MVNEGIEYSAGVGGGERPVNPVEASLQIANNEGYYKAFVNWFRAPQPTREAALQSSFRSMAESDGDFYGATLNENLPPADSFVLRSVALLTSDDAQKILDPDNPDQLTVTDFVRIRDDARRAMFSIEEITEKAGITFEITDIYDIVPTQKVINGNFSPDEMLEFLKKVATRVPLDEDLHRIVTGIVHPIKNCDLVLDPQFRPYVEALYVPTNPERFQTDLTNCITQSFMPKPEYFELLFKEQPDSTDPKRQVEHGDKKFPASLLYFALLRVPITSKDGLSPKNTELLTSRAADYLLSDEFMNHVRPYFGTEDAYPDVFARNMSGGYYGYDLNIVASGDEGKTVKRRQFMEVVEAVEKHLQEKGDQERLGHLKDKSKEWSDFLSK